MRRRVLRRSCQPGGGECPAGACARPAERAVRYLARPGRVTRAGKHPHVPADSAPDIDAEAILELRVHYGSLEFAFQFGQGVATATYDSFHDAFADVPASASRGFVATLIPYILARIS